MSDCQRGSGLENGFIDRFNIRPVSTINYIAIANLHNLHITAAHAKSLPARSVLTSSRLATAPNTGYSSASVLKSSLNGDSLVSMSWRQVS
jgi:hypothetical protein